MKAARFLLLATLILCGNLLARTNPIPFVNQPLVPDAAQPGGSGFTLTVNGTGFVSGSVVNWNGSPRPTIFVSGLQLTATISASDIATPNTAAVTVVNPSPGGGRSNPADFVVALPAPDVAMLASHFFGDTGFFMTSGVAADFNGDGKLDVAVALNGTGSGEVAVLLGNGKGSFRRVATIPTPFLAGNLIAADFNGDGKLDLALITNLNQVSVLLGNGDGTFQPAMTFLTGIGPISIVAGDFNHDGNLDLATSNSTDNSVSVLLGKGDGTFLPHVDTSTGGVLSYGLAVGDFNQDGQLDLAVTEDASNEVTILLGNGDGTFVFETDLIAPNPGVVATADVNQDGKLDLLVGSGSGQNGVFYTWQTLFLGNGDGTFQQGQVVSRSNTGGEQAATVADMNADGNLDLVVLNAFGDVSVLLGDGTGAFHLVYDVLVAIQFGGFPDEVAVTGDFNNDGKIDVITSDFRNSSDITLLLQSSVVFSPASVSFFSVPVGKKSPQRTATLTNTDVSMLKISNISVTGINRKDFKESNDCPSSLAPGSTCSIKVTFKPSIRGRELASVHIVDSGPRGGQGLPLSGHGI